MPRPILLSAHARNMEEIYTIPELHHFLDAINAQEMDKAYAHVPDTYELGHGVIGQISLAAICVHQNKIEHFRFLLGKKTVPRWFWWNGNVNLEFEIWFQETQ